MADVTEAGSRKTNVFISYSRRDAEIADRLHEKLTAEGLNPYLDKHDIAAGEDWKSRLGGLIEAADTMVFLVSPDSIASKVCDWEINHAELKGKRILPVVCREAAEDEVPERLRRLNYVFMRNGAEEIAALPRLAEALAVDIAWIRNHTRYGDDAGEWDKAGRPSRLLLRGASIGEAERWRDSRPPTAPRLTETQSAFIASSRQGATNRQRGWIAGSITVALFALGLSVYALLQQRAAEASRRETGTVLATSDYRQGSDLADTAETAPDGIAFLARAARGGDRRAQTRLWTLWQQRSFWLPLPDEPSPAVVRAAPAIPADLAARFASVDYNGEAVETHNVAISADGLVVFVVVGGIADPVVQDVNVRVFRSDGTPLTEWFAPPYTGEMYLADARAALSPQGRYLALEIQGWREASYVLVYDLERSPLVPFADRIVATGSRPGIQGAAFTVLRFEAQPDKTDTDQPPILLAGSSRGDAGVYRATDADYFPIAIAGHRAAVSLMELDESRDWLLSASTDRFVAVTELTGGGPIGSPMRVGEAVVRVTRAGPSEVAIDQEGDLRTRFAFQPPIARRYAGSASEAEGLGSIQEACYRAGGLSISEAPVVHPSGLTLSIERDRSAIVRRTDGTRSESPRFLAAIATICASDDGKFVSVTTDDFRTEIWTSDFARRLGPAMDESAYFSAEWPSPETTDWVQLSPDGASALVRSSFWDPPNLEYFWLMAFDTATGLPLSEHQAFVDEGDGPVTSATYDASRGQVAYLSNGQPTGAMLDLNPPPEMLDGLPTYMEGVVGQLIDPTGLSQTVPLANRIERLNAGNALLGGPEGSR